MRQRLVPPHRDQRGFTLVEVMVAAMVLMIGVLGTFVMIDGANQTTRDNNARTAVSAVAREILEQARTVDYEKITPSQLIPELRTKPALQGTLDSAGNWVVRQRNIKLTISASVCTYDDPADGRGDPAVPMPAEQAPCPAGHAPTSTTPPPVDSNPDDFRRVTLTLKWYQGGNERQIKQTAQLNNPSGGLGPRIILFPNPNGGAQITSGSAVPFTATSTWANNITWAADDGRTQGRGSLTGGGTAWSWNWNIGTPGTGTPSVDWVLDGAYTISAQPFDSRGVPGEMRIASVWLNRRAPLPVPGLLGGRSGQTSGAASVVEMDWNANPERDVIGYRVYRYINDALDRRICPASTAPEAVTTNRFCVDGNPPSGGNLDYKVVAVDRTDIKNPLSSTRETLHAEASTIDVPTSTGSTTRLDAPTGLKVTTNAAQKPQLDWNTTTDSVYFYRVYRNGVRIGRTSGPTPSFVDNDPLDSTYRYQVSAVHNPSFNEGRLSGEVVWSLGG